MIRLIAVALLAWLNVPLFAAEPDGLVPLVRFYNKRVNEHAYACSPRELALWRFTPDVQEHQAIGMVATTQLPGTVRLWRGIRDRDQRHLYYTDARLLVKGSSFKPDDSNFSAYVWEKPGDGRIGVYCSTWTDGTDVFFEPQLANVLKFSENTRRALGVERLRKGNTPAFYVYPPSSSNDAGDSKVAVDMESDASEAGELRKASIAAPKVSLPIEQPPALADIIETCERSVVRIDVESDSGGGLGSGFLARPGIIVTNVHVLAGAQSASVIFPNEQMFRIEGTLYIDASKDIAIAKLSSPAALELPVLSLSSVPPRKGEPVVALGSPLGLSFTATSGVISAIRSAKEIGDEADGRKLNGTWIQVDAALSPGNSGGPIINNMGLVVAMSTLASTTAQNLNFGISSADLQLALDAAEHQPVRPLGELHRQPGSAPSPRRDSGSIERVLIPQAALASYVERGRKEFKDLKQDMSRELARLRTALREMRAGQPGIPDGLAKPNVDVVRVTPSNKKSGHTYYFRSEKIKEREIAAAEARLRELGELGQVLQSPDDSKSLTALLQKYGPKIDTRQNGSIGFLSECDVVRVLNGNDVLANYNGVPYLVSLQSTVGLWIGQELTAIPVYVNGTASAGFAESGSTTLTVLQSVTAEEIDAAVRRESPAASADADKPAVNEGITPSQKQEAESEPVRTWRDPSGKFSVEATLLEVSNDIAVLRRTDGRILRIQINKLCKNDQEYLQARSKGK